MSETLDQSPRRRFAEELDRNFGGSHPPGPAKPRRSPIAWLSSPAPAMPWNPAQTGGGHF